MVYVISQTPLLKERSQLGTRPLASKPTEGKAGKPLGAARLGSPKDIEGQAPGGHGQRVLRA